MSLIINTELPAHSLLESEGVNLQREAALGANWMPPLSIGVVNLMPKKVETETQLARLLGSSPFPVQLDFIRLDGHEVKTTSYAHMEAFYRPFSSVRNERFDGFVITGAPIEHLAFEEVDYWKELCDIFDWLEDNVYSTMGICWGAMALAYHFHGLPKHMLTEKVFGCYGHHRVARSSTFLSGFTDGFHVPVSRNSEVRQGDIDLIKDLSTLLVGDAGGPAVVEDTARRSLLIFNHFEYDWNTLQQEYERDLKAGVDIAIPENYFPNDDPGLKPVNNWSWQGHLLFWNWLSVLAENKVNASSHVRRPLPYAI